MASQNMGIVIELCKGPLQLACPTGVGKMFVFGKRVLLTQGQKLPRAKFGQHQVKQLFRIVSLGQNLTLLSKLCLTAFYFNQVERIVLEWLVQIS